LYKIAASDDHLANNILLRANSLIYVQPWLPSARAKIKTAFIVYFRGSI